jgi:hypothetical protein
MKLPEIPNRLPRQLLGFIGFFGGIYWSISATLAFMLAWHTEKKDVFFVFGTLATFVFYFVIAIRPCRGLTALWLGIVLHIPYIGAMVCLIQHGESIMRCAIVFGFGILIWAIYTFQLMRRK